MKMKKGLVSCLSFLVAGAAAQQSAYGQCGGSSYTGSTSCTSGYTCTSQNPYYYQCVPGTASATATSATTSPKTTTSVVSLLPLELRAGPGGGGNFHFANTDTTIVTSVSSSFTVKTTSATTTSTTTKAPTSSATKTFSSAASSATGAFAQTDGLLFNIDGVTEYYAGTNCYWCGFLASDEDVDTVFSHIATSGLKILRVWGFNDVNTIPSTGTVWYQYLSSSGSEINTGEYGLERLDAVVAAAETYGIKLIVNFVNNWSDYGGIAAYVAAFGGSATSWFTDSASQAQYQTYIKAVVSRYTTSTAIFSWELANEPRCSGCDTYVSHIGNHFVHGQDC